MSGKQKLLAPASVKHGMYRDWSEWGRMDKNVVVVRTSRHIGISESRNAGLKTLAGKVDRALLCIRWFHALLQLYDRVDET